MLMMATTTAPVVDDPPNRGGRWLSLSQSASNRGSPTGIPSASMPRTQTQNQNQNQLSMTYPSKYRCECGTLFTRSQEKASHCKHCRVHIGKKEEFKAAMTSAGVTMQPSHSHSHSHSQPHQRHFQNAPQERPVGALRRSMSMSSGAHEPAAAVVGRNVIRLQPPLNLNCSVPNRPPDLPASTSALFGGGAACVGGYGSYLAESSSTGSWSGGSSSDVPSSPVVLASPLGCEGFAPPSPLQTMSTTRRDFGGRSRGLACHRAEGDQEMQPQLRCQGSRQLGGFPPPQFAPPHQVLAPLCATASCDRNGMSPGVEPLPMLCETAPATLLQASCQDVPMPSPSLNPSRMSINFLVQ